MAAVIVIVVVVVLAFVFGVVAPRKSKRAQQVRDRIMRRGEQKGKDHAGLAGDAAKGTIKATRKAEDRAAEAGREAHDDVAHPGRQD
jgi:F0F1-type ATP synthase membrane subunit b/b'